MKPLKEVLQGFQKAPVYLTTDASDYGIGGYLFQRKREEDRPMAILSKTLDRTQLR